MVQKSVYCACSHSKTESSFNELFVYIKVEKIKKSDFRGSLYLKHIWQAVPNLSFFLKTNYFDNFCHGHMTTVIVIKILPSQNYPSTFFLASQNECWKIVGGVPVQFPPYLCSTIIINWRGVLKNKTFIYCPRSERSERGGFIASRNGKVAWNFVIFFFRIFR